MSNIARDMEVATRGFRAVAQSLADTAQMVRSGSESMQAILQSVNSINLIPEMLQRQNEGFTFLMLRLAERSWYFGMDMPISDMVQLEEAVSEEDYDLVDTELAGWHRCRAQQVIEKIMEKFPERALVIRPALKAHKERNYELAIPAFLAQADGIAYDYLTENFFRTVRWRDKLDEFMRRNSLTEFSTVMLMPLYKAGTLRRSTSGLPSGGDVLNRHQILHGLTCDYGTEINSLKCIGLLDCLYSTGEMILKGEPEQGA